MGGALMIKANQDKPQALRRWHEIVATGNAAALDDLLAEGVVFYSPVVHTPQAGRAKTRLYLGAAMQVLFGGEFRYTDEWIGETSAVLEFSTKIGVIEVNGVDIIGWNEDGRIDRFKVMLRPLKAIQAVQDEMAAMLAAMPPR
jgi:hypothetical protein